MVAFFFVWIGIVRALTTRQMGPALGADSPVNPR
jgi:hypothetical protein